MMEFLHIEYFYIFIPFFILLAIVLKKKSQINQLFSATMLKRLTVNSKSFSKNIKNTLLFFALALLIFALARPVVMDQTQEKEHKRGTLFVLFDISASMGVDDYYPTRFEFAKHKFYKFLEMSEGFDIGLGAYASDFFLVSPVTSDKNILQYFTENLDFSYISNKGTSTLSALYGAKRVLKKQKERYVILFTDGGDEKEFTKEIEYAKENNIHVYIIATAKPSGAAIKTENGLQKDKEGNIFISKLNTNIKELSLQSGGAYIKAASSNKDLKLILTDIKKKATLSLNKKKSTVVVQELFYYPLGLGLLFLIMVLSSLPRKDI